MEDTTITDASEVLMTATEVSTPDTVPTLVLVTIPVVVMDTETTTMVSALVTA